MSDGLLQLGGIPGLAAAAAGARPPAELAAAVHEALAATGTELPLPAEPMAEWGPVGQGRLAETELLAVYARVSGLPVLDEEATGELETVDGLMFDFLSRGLVLPLRRDGERLLVAVAAPYDLAALAWQLHTGLGLEPLFTLARRSWIERHLAGVYEKGGDRRDAGLPGIDGDASEAALRDLAREAPVVRTVSDLFARALEMGASDIHVEPGEDSMAVRFRVDGVMQTVQTLPPSSFAAIASRLKLLANLNIAERRLPQDGRIDLQSGGRRLDVRVSTMPSMHGESVVMRLLQKDVSIFRLETLGMDERLRGEFERVVQMPHGIILVVGPTGSGKTTTLYSVMRILNSDEVKIITLEDPVEYQIPGLTQIQVKSQIGLTFASGLRSIVRQDPDIILVGEIRDRETADIAIHAALTGHLVLSTLHTNDAPGAVSRLLDMGVEGFLISSSLLCVLSQRLVRKTCTACGGGRRPPESAVNGDAPRNVHYYTAAPAPAPGSADASASTN